MAQVVTLVVQDTLEIIMCTVEVIIIQVMVLEVLVIHLEIPEVIIMCTVRVNTGAVVELLCQVLAPTLIWILMLVSRQQRVIHTLHMVATVTVLT